MTLKLVTAPNEEPVSIADAKAYLRVDHNEDDSLITSLIKVATSAAEKYTRRAFVTQTWDLWLDQFPSKTKLGESGWWDGVREAPISSILESVRLIEIPKPPLQSVTFLKTYDVSDTEEEFSSSRYFVDEQSDPGRLSLKFGEIWPAVILRPVNGVQVRFVAGYGDAASVPEQIKTAIKMILVSLYENRGCSPDELPPTACALLDPYIVMRL